jgi:transposase
MRVQLITYKPVLTVQRNRATTKVSEVSERLGVSTYSLYKWLKQARGNNGRHGKDHAKALQKENLRLKSELKRVEEERDILKKAAAYFAKTSG